MRYLACFAHIFQLNPSDSVLMFGLNLNASFSILNASHVVNLPSQLLRIGELAVFHFYYLNKRVEWTSSCQFTCNLKITQFFSIQFYSACVKQHLSASKLSVLWLLYIFIRDHNLRKNICKNTKADFIVLLNRRLKNLINQLYV